jgi:hypothetical protein
MSPHALGEFGIVYKGYIKTSDSHSIEEYLAIKTLKGMLINIIACTPLSSKLIFSFSL